MMGRYSYTKAMAKLVKWAERLGYTINFDKGNSQIWVDERYREIWIEGNYPIEIRFYTLLHELGHHQIRKDWKKFKKAMPILAHAEYLHFYKNTNKYKRRLTYSVFCLEEEFKEWEEGKKLADKLGLRVNQSNWDKLKSECLMTYIRKYGKK